ISPQELLHILGKEAVQTFLVDEVQKVYRSQGVDINDKHIEVIVRQMMRKVRIDSAGDTGLLPGEIVSQWEYEESNARALAEGGARQGCPFFLGEGTWVPWSEKCLGTAGVNPAYSRRLFKMNP